MQSGNAFQTSKDEYENIHSDLTFRHLHIFASKNTSLLSLRLYLSDGNFLETKSRRYCVEDPC